MKAASADRIGFFIGEDPFMKKIISCLGATSVIVATFGVASVVPAIGAPINLRPMQIPHPSEITYVNWHGGGWHGGGWHGGGWHGGGWHGGGWHGGGWHGGGYYGGWYPGYGGYYGDDLWVAGGALLLGALIGGAIANSANYGDHYYGHPHGYRQPYYIHRHSYTPYTVHYADPYLGWQRGLDR